MAEAITIETIFALFKETDRQMQETERILRFNSEETDRKMRETDRKMRETDRKMRETDRKMQETDRKMQETDRKIKEVSVLVGNLGNRLGEFVESMVRPAAVKLFQDRGIEVTQIFQNAVVTRGKEGIEVDLLVVNGSELVATECKSKLGVEDIDRHIERLEKIRRMFPQWAEYRIYGAVATMVLENKVEHYAEEKGLFVIVPSGDTVEIRNGKDFLPKAY